MEDTKNPRRIESRNEKEEINSKAYPYPLRVAERNCILPREIKSRNSYPYPLHMPRGILILVFTNGYLVKVVYVEVVSQI